MKQTSLLCVVCFLMGCNGSETSVDYASVQRPNSVMDLNGLGVHMRMWEIAGARCMLPTKLSPLLERCEVIVLAGSTFDPPAREAMDWLEQWLSAADGRTVIYFGRDFAAEVYYRQSTLDEVAPGKLERARELLALCMADQFQRRVEKVSEPIFCRWFLRSGLTAKRELTGLQGAWANSEIITAKWPVATHLEPPTPAVRRRTRDAMVKQFPSTPKVNTRTPGTPSKHYRAVWAHEDIDTAEELDQAWDQAPDSEVLLSGQDGTPLLFRLTSEAFSGSQILVIANGAPLLNGSLVEPTFRRIGQQLVDQCLPAKRVALLAYNEQGILISEIDEKDPRTAGLEMLTVWPLNIVMTHAALLGILVCIVLLPILGRPQGLPRRSLSDFGQHVQALGRLLQKSQDQAYAQRMIAAYFETVRKESIPPWIQVPAPQSPMQGTKKTVAPYARFGSIGYDTSLRNSNPLNSKSSGEGRINPFAGRPVRHGGESQSRSNTACALRKKSLKRSRKNCTRCLWVRMNWC